jgi:hypothetical protein
MADRQIVALIDAHSRSRQRVAANVTGLVRRLLATLSGRWYDDAAVRAVGQQITAAVRRGQLVTGDATAAYLEQVLAHLGEPLPADVTRTRVDLPDPLRDVDPAEEWNRPAKVYRRARLLGESDLRAAELAAQRAEQLVDMDLGLAMRESARQRLASVDTITGYRRIIHPELSESGTCGLCAVASDRIYKTGELLPIHAGCQCDVLPIVRGKTDPGQALNRDELGELYRAAGGTEAAKLKRIRVAVREHGELGPVLTDADHHWRGPSDVEADVA